jgi:hypothetical protein
MRKNQQIQQLFIQFINCVWQLLRVSALHCHLQGAQGASSDVVRAHHAATHIASIHNILRVLTAPQWSIYQKALGTLPEDGNVMPKHVGATIHN